jgi:hypothetical protein
VTRFFCKTFSKAYKDIPTQNVYFPSAHDSEYIDMRSRDDFLQFPQIINTSEHSTSNVVCDELAKNKMAIVDEDKETIPDVLEPPKKKKAIWNNENEKLPAALNVLETPKKENAV